MSESVLTERLTSGGRVLDAAQRALLPTLVSPHAQGVYLWGGVGRGKTWMAETFYQLASGPKHRAHLHQFLSDLHFALTQRRHAFGTTLTNFLGGTRLLYLDEFHLHDVADAHLIRRTLTTAQTSGVALLMTSNYPPEELLPHPLYHHHALPVIEQITTTTTVAHIGKGVDYRTHVRSAQGFASGTWVRTGLREDTPRIEVSLATPPPHGASTRKLRAFAAEDGVLTVSFAQLCQEPLSAADYTQLAEHFATVQLVNVPPVELIGEEPMQRFAYLIDVLVNADVRLDVSSALGLGAWFTTANLPRDADRLLSRLSLLREAPSTS